MDIKTGCSLLVLGQLFSWMLVDCNRVLLVSMDGFRSDYISQVDTPNFDAFAANGTRADYITGSFVTKTFPSHYTIATGLYEESHGIIGNNMYDPDFNETFNKGSTDSKWWDGGEPLWVTTRRQKMSSGVYFWPGSESVIKALRPTIYKVYNETVPFKFRIDTVIQWLFNTSFYDIDLAMVYFHEPDRTGHDFGPNSQELRRIVEEMDGILGYIVEEFDKANLWDKVNVIVTSDHGMAEVDYSARHIDLSTRINMDAIDKIPFGGAVSNILPKVNMAEEIIQNLTGVPYLTVYRKEDIPDHWHYRNNRRIMPILLVADEGWIIVKDSDEYSYARKGDHGYDNTLPSMKPIFYARGPNIKSGFKVSPFNSVDIYPLVCELLGIQPATNNGTLANTRYFIVYDHPTSEASMLQLSLLLIAAMGVTLYIESVLY